MVISQKIVEKKMGNRGSKSDFITFAFALLQPKAKVKSVKEQRVDGSCFGYKPKLRCTLMGGASCYRIKILSKQLNKNFSTLHSSWPLLHLRNEKQMAPEAKAISSFLPDKLNP